MKFVFLLLILLVGCQSAYKDCKSDCLRYVQNCTEPNAFCIPPPCNTNHTCTDLDFKYCLDKCSLNVEVKT